MLAKVTNLVDRSSTAICTTDACIRLITMRSLFSYYGGKACMAHHILPLFPPHTVYVEPYCGGASLLFAKPRRVVSSTHHYREVLNDQDQRIMTIYRVCQEATTRQALVDRLTYTPYSRAAYAEASHVIRHSWDAAGDVQRAWAMLVSLQQSFNHKMIGGWSTKVFHENPASTWTIWRDALPALMNRLTDVHLECDDAIAVIRRWDSPQTLFYLDPPYVGAHQGHYDGFSATDLKALIECLETCQGSIVLSGYVHEAIPKAWECFIFEAYAHASGTGTTHGHDRTQAATGATLGDRRRVECVWRVDRSAGMRDELAQLFVTSPQRSLFDEGDCAVHTETLSFREESPP
jgi:DNA adenine methylase